MLPTQLIVLNNAMVIPELRYKSKAGINDAC